MSLRLYTAANVVYDEVSNSDVRFRETDEMCPICQHDLEVYYCENRTYIVRCRHCMTITIVKASNPHEAAEKVGLDIKNSFRRCGSWIAQDDGFGGEYYTCSECKEDWYIPEGSPAENNMQYCPQCGAKMDLEV